MGSIVRYRRGLVLASRVAGWYIIGSSAGSGTREGQAANLDRISEELSSMLPEDLKQAGSDVLWLYASKNRG